MLHAYMDDSGTHAGSPYCLVGGYWGGTGQWSKFGREWSKILKAFNVPEFHSKQFWARDHNKNRVGPYKGWDDNRRDGFLDQLLNVIGTHRIYPFAHGVSRSAWERLGEVQQRAICGPSGKEYTAPNNPMFVAFQTCVIRNLAHCHAGVRMTFILDSNQNTDKWAAIAFEELRRILAKAGDSLAAKLGNLTFGESIRTPQLQAADLLAYEAFKYSKWAKGNNDVKVRLPYMLALRNFRSVEDFWLYDDQRFKDISLIASQSLKKNTET